MMSKDSMESQQVCQQGKAAKKIAPNEDVILHPGPNDVSHLFGFLQEAELPIVLQRHVPFLCSPIQHYQVLMGRGAPSTDFTGNLRFRELVKERRHDYVNAKRRKDKQGVAGEIIATVKQRGGRFLSRVEAYHEAGNNDNDDETRKVTIWEPVEDRKTLLVKVKQLMRDVGPM